MGREGAIPADRAAGHGRRRQGRHHPQGFTAFNPQGTRVTGFGVPTEEELAHDFLWRIHPNAPGKGRIGIFNRSHYEDVLVVRVNELAPKTVWSGRYDLINAFEQSLAAAAPRS